MQAQIDKSKAFTSQVRWKWAHLKISNGTGRFYSEMLWTLRNVEDNFQISAQEKFTIRLMADQLESYFTPSRTATKQARRMTYGSGCLLYFTFDLIERIDKGFILPIN